MALTSRLWLRLDPEARSRLEALQKLAHESTIATTVRRLIHDAYERHDCRGEGCPVCEHRVDALARRRERT